MEASLVCKYYQTGYCKFGENCRNLHIDDICSSNPNCEDKSCSKRHPRKCKYYCIYGHCKFGSKCAYLHFSLLDELASDLYSLKQEVEKLRESSDTIIKKSEDHQIKIDVFNEEFSEYAQAVDMLEGKVRDIDVEMEFTVKEGSCKLEKNIHEMIEACLLRKMTPSPRSYIAAVPIPPTPPSSVKKKT